MYKMIESYYEHADRGEVTDRLTDTEKAVKMRERVLEGLRIRK